MYLYRYVIVNDTYKNTENLICRSNIRLNFPDEFNDPFDLNILPRADLHQKDLQEWIEYQERIRTYTQEEKELIKRFKEEGGDITNPAFVSGIIAGALKGGIRTHGIYCLSKTWDSILMWSIYANKHQGICIRFNLNKESEIAKYLADVKYSLDYPQVYINEEKHYSSFFTTKFLVWQNEMEVRIIKPHGGGEIINLEDGIIDAIIIGIKTPVQEIDTILNWVRNIKNKPKLFKALLTMRDYRIDRKPIELIDEITANDIYNMHNFDKKLFEDRYLHV